MVEKRVGVRFVAEDGGKVRAEIKGMQADLQQLFQGATLSQKSAVASANAFEEAIEAEARAFAELRASIDPAFAATRRYEQAVQAAQRAVKLGAATQEQANLVIAQAQTRLDMFAGVITAQGRGLNAYRGQIQNAAFQVGDFAVQVGAGTAASVALAQQLPQLLGGFGVLGAVLGAVVAIGLPLSASFFRSGENAEDLDGAISGLNSTIGSYRDAAILASQSTGDLRSEFGSFADEIRRAADYMAQVKLGIALDSMEASIEPLKAGLAGVVEQMGLISLATDQYMAAAARGTDEAAISAEAAERIIASLTTDATAAAAKFGLLPDQAVQLAGAIDDLGTATGIDQIAERAATALRLIEDFAPAGAQLSPELSVAADYLGDILQDASRTVGALERAQDEARGAAGAMLEVQNVSWAAAGMGSILADALSRADASAKALASIDIVGPIAAAANTAATLANNMSISVAAAQALLRMGGGPSEVIFDPRDPNFDPVAAEAERLRLSAGTVSPFDPSRNRPAAAGGSDGGTSPADEAIKLAEQLQDQVDGLMGRLDPALRAYQQFTEQQNILNEGWEAGIITAQQQAIAMGQVTAEYERARAAASPYADEIKAISSTLADVAVRGQNLRESLADLWQDMAADLVQSGLQTLIEQLLTTTATSTNLLSSVLGALGLGAQTGTPVSTLPGNAAGTDYWKGGPTWVGERGPEILNLPRGSQIIDAERSRKMVKGGGGDRPINVAYNIDARGAQAGVADQIVSAIAAYDRNLPARVKMISEDPWGV